MWNKNNLNSIKVFLCVIEHGKVRHTVKVYFFECLKNLTKKIFVFYALKQSAIWFARNGQLLSTYLFLKKLSDKDVFVGTIVSDSKRLRHDRSQKWWLYVLYNTITTNRATSTSWTNKLLGMYKTCTAISVRLKGNPEKSIIVFYYNQKKIFHA